MLVDRKPKTVVMHVVNKSGKILGKISWLAQWRQYTFDPEAYTTFNNGCLQDITDVLASLNSEHKNNNLAKDGIYLLRDPSGYEKTVEASFDGNGKLVICWSPFKTRKAEIKMETTGSSGQTMWFGQNRENHINKQHRRLTVYGTIR